MRSRGRSATSRRSARRSRRCSATPRRGRSSSTSSASRERNRRDTMSTEQKGATVAATGETTLLDEILKETKLKPTDDGYDVARRGVQAFITELPAPARAQEKIDKAIVDVMVSEIDKRISAQVNEILHHPELQKLESAWRGLKFLIDR